MWPQIQLGAILLPTYNLILALGVLAALAVFFFACRRKRLALPFVADHFFIFFFAGLVVSRIVEMLLYSYPISSFFLFWRDSGFNFFGLALGLIGALFFLARRHHEPFFRWLDVFGFVAAALMFFESLASFAAGAAYGQATSLPWGIIFDDPAAAIFTTIPIHPTQLYSALAWIIAFVAGSVAYQKSQQSGFAFSVIAAISSSLLFFIEFLRADSAPSFAGLRAGQWESLLVAAIAFFILVRFWRLVAQHREHQEVPFNS